MDEISKSLFSNGFIGEYRDPNGTFDMENAILSVFGKKLSPNELADLISAPSGCETEVFLEKSKCINQLDIVCVNAVHPETGLLLNRQFYSHNGYRLVFHNGFMRGDHVKGTGIRVLAREVRNYRQRGFRLISTKAGRNPDQQGNWRAEAPHVQEIGFWFWLSLGFRADFETPLLEKVQSEYSYATNSHDLFELDGGLEWWKQNGESVFAQFDLSPKSHHSQIFAKQLQSKLVDIEL